MKNRGPTLQIRLPAEDHARLHEFAVLHGISHNKVVMEAVLAFIASKEWEKEVDKQGPFATQIKEAKEELKAAFAKGVNRISALLAKTAISAETANELLAANADLKASLGQARHLAAKKVARALSYEEQKAAEGMNRFIDK
jgi:hypothetical protein